MRTMSKWSKMQQYHRYIIENNGFWDAQCPYNIKHCNNTNLQAWQKDTRFNKWFEIGQNKHKNSKPYRLFWRLKYNPSYCRGDKINYE